MRMTKGLKTGQMRWRQDRGMNEIHRGKITCPQVIVRKGRRMVDGVVKNNSQVWDLGARWMKKWGY